MRPAAVTRMAAAAAAIVMVWALLLLLVPPVAGQGLSISPEQLGAGEAAVVDEFSKFEEILDLYSQSTGGRGRSGRGGSATSKTGIGFRSVKSLQQLQLAMYYLAGSPPAYNNWNTSRNPGGINLLPGVRDQLDCDSCVAQAIAAAIQAAAGAAWRQNADQARFNVSAASLYYCSEGGKTCKTGWDLQEALAMIMDKSQFLIRPTACASKTSSGMLDNPTSEPQVFDWKPTCQEAEQACSSKSSRALPWLSCTYKSLSSFVEIQRHIRQHGGVLTRITIYDDFSKHFNVTSDGGEPRAAVSGATHKAYNRTGDSRSKPLFGHAALIVGYNNTELTWTLLNSYGTQRFTLDGLFKIAMGVAGVAVPDQTFGIECKPTPGGPDDLHFTDWLTPWIADPALRPRKPVDYWDRANDWNNLNASCYRYNMTAQDTVSSVADAFGVSLQQLVRDNQALFLPLQQVNYTLKTGTQLKDLQRVADVAKSLRLDNGSDPFFVCRTRKEGQTWPGKVACKQSDLAPCAGSFGPCTIVYSETDVSVVLSPGTALKVCNISRVDEPGAFDRVAYLKEPRDSQPRPLKALLQALPGGAGQDVADKPHDQLCYTNDPWMFTTILKAICRGNTNGIVTYLDFNEPGLPFTFQDAHAVYALLNLHGLVELMVPITGGPLPSQLGVLKLEKLIVRNQCSSSNNWGPLPDNWLLGTWRKSLVELKIGASDENGFAAANERCGVTGTLPAAWFEPGAPSAALTMLDLSFNQITGGLPQALPMAMPRLEELDLSWNAFEGPIPPSFSNLTSLWQLNLRSNKIEGFLPLGLKPYSLLLDDNPGLQGCVPVIASRGRPDAVGYARTRITGMCKADADSLWLLQLQALNQLPVLMGTPIDIASRLPQTLAAFYATYPDAASTPSRKYIFGPGLAGAVELQVTNGMPCVLSLRLEIPAVFDRHFSPIDIRALPGILRRLLWLETISVVLWSGFGNFNLKADKPDARYQLPLALPKVAPSLKSLTLFGCGLTGTLPEWANWTSLQELSLGVNFLSGPLPEWRDMVSLQKLDLSANNISGSLPASWADSMPASMTSMDLRYNRGINGSIPVSWWQHFSQYATLLYGTALTGCKPPGWGGFISWPDGIDNAPFCVAGETVVMQRLKQLLQTAIPSSPLWSRWQTTDDSSGSSGVISSTLLAHCRNWQGIACNANGQVIGVDLSSLQGTVSSPINLTTLLRPLAGLAQLQTLELHNNPQLFAGSTLSKTRIWSAWPKLQHLDVSNCNLTGSLPASLGDLPSLAHLNTSHNPGMSGPLPELLSATSLTVLDVFECSLSGQLPISFTVLPLRLLRVGSSVRPASADGSIGGPLPPEYGMIDTLRELHIVNTWVTGGIPSAWFDPAEAATAATAATAMKAATAAAAIPSGSAVVAGAAASSEQPAQQAGGAAARMAAAWQRVQDRIRRSTTAAPVAAAAPAGEGLSMQQLEVLVLSGNTGLEGSLPPQLAALKRLKVLRLSGSKLAGLLPRGYGRLSQLQELDLSRNQLSGGIPSLWLGLRSLSLMDLSGNPAIGGPLPATLYKMAGPERSLRCLRLFGTGADGQWNQTAGGLAAVKAALEGRPGSQVTVAISSNAPEC